LSDVSLDSITIDAGGQTLVVPLDPSMSSLTDARVRLVEMDKQSVLGLNRSPVTLKEYRPPKGFPAIIFAAALGTYLLYSRRQNMEPGSLPYELVLKHVPRFNDFALKVRDLVIWPMLGIHLFEASIMSSTLKKYSVPLFSRVWWLWTISCFIEGINSFQR
jgi:hypothetical protein